MLKFPLFKSTCSYILVPQISLIYVRMYYVHMYTVEPVYYYGHLGTNQKCPDYLGVLLFQVRLYEKARGESIMLFELPIILPGNSF